MRIGIRDNQLEISDSMKFDKIIDQINEKTHLGDEDSIDLETEFICMEEDKPRKIVDMLKTIKPKNIDLEFKPKTNIIYSLRVRGGLIESIGALNLFGNMEIDFLSTTKMIDANLLRQLLETSFQMGYPFGRPFNNFNSPTLKLIGSKNFDIDTPNIISGMRRLTNARRKEIVDKAFMAVYDEKLDDVPNTDNEEINKLTYQNIDQNILEQIIQEYMN